MGSFIELTASRCEKLQNLSYLNLTISIFLLLGILVSYLPQHFRIIQRRTSEGISPYFILLGTTSGTCGLANIMTLPASRADVACCKVVSSFECFAGLLGIAQVGVQWSCFTLILVLFLIFFPRDSPLPDNSSDEQPKWRTALIVGFLCVLHGLAVVLVSTYIVLLRPDYLGMWANLLGICATILACVQYFPQIWTTYNLGHVGSLSIPMMLIQTPGSFVWSGSLAARLGVEGWSTWGVYLVTGCLQGCLLVMGIYFEVQARKTSREAEDRVLSNGASATASLPFHDTAVETDDEGAAVVENGHSTERTPLLNNSRKGSQL